MMTTILQIETATQTCSAAIAVNGKTIAVKEQAAQNIHAGSLTLFIEDVMKQSSLSFADLDAVAVSMGPGSYTGLRIGVSTAKGLCFALDKPLIAVDTLKMMSIGFLLENEGYTDLVCPMIDARRMEVYSALYNNRLDIILPIGARIIEANSFDELFKDSKIAFIGDGAMKCNELIRNQNAMFFSENFNSASNMSVLAFDSFSKKGFVDVAYFEPYYLKDFVFTQPKKKF
jgi:tRNA threonylcarbamoyladenosine biosynthesis protein TsaB